MDLDDISTDSSVGDASPQNFKVTLLYDSEDSDTPVGSIMFSSDEDVLLSSGQEDHRKVRKRDHRPVSQPVPTDGPASERTPEPTPTEKMSPVGSVQRTAEPVSVAAKSEMFTPVFAGGSLLRQPPCPWAW